MQATASYASPRPFRLLLLAGLLGLALLASLQLAASVELDLVLEMRMLAHPVLKHGEEATSIRRCLERNGPNEIWKFTSHRRKGFFIFTCLLDDGRWGIQIAQLTKLGEWIEKTAFVIKDGTPFQLKEYITARAIRFLGDLASYTL